MKATLKDAPLSILEAVEGALERAGVARSGVLVACSGGVDSVCLLRLLAGTLGAAGGRIEVAHVDHALREGSALDAEFCSSLAQELGLPFHLLHLDPDDLTGGGGLQAEGRRLRRRFLEGTRESRGLGAIALGHHADDQVETVLFRMLRGTGPRGLGGMGAWAPPYLRPLLALRRADLEALARSQEWRHREDPSNGTDRYARNRLRRRVLPALRSVHPGIDDALLRLARLTREDDACLTGLAREAFVRTAVREPEGFRFAVEALVSLEAAVRRRVYLAAWEGLGCEPGALEARHLEVVEKLLEPGRAHRRAPIPGPAAVAVSYGDLWFLRPGAVSPGTKEVRLGAPGRQPQVPGGISWTRERPSGRPCVGVPSDRGRGGIWARTRRAGDRLRLGQGKEVKVKDLLMEARLPQWRRAGAVVVGDDEGVLGVLAVGKAWGGSLGGGGWLSLAGDEGPGNPDGPEIPLENGCCPSDRCDT